MVITYLDYLYTSDQDLELLQVLKETMKSQSQSHLQQWNQSHLQPWNLLNRSLWFFVTFLHLVSMEAIESHTLIKTLPGFDGDLPFTLETGYIGIGESDDIQLFYSFVESQRDPQSDPVMLVLLGGPGCSGIINLISNAGPLITNYANFPSEKQMLELNSYSWTKASNIIYIDQPVGTGFSYAKTPEAYKTNDTLSATHTHHFMRKWFLDHPKFLNNPFYLFASSYSGIVAPLIVQEIYNGNEVGEEPKINIKGYILNSPLTDKSGDYNSRIPVAHRLGLLSDMIYKSTKEHCHGEYLNVDPNNTLCVHDLQVVDKCLERIDLYDILEPNCDTSNNLKSNPSGRVLRSLDKSYSNIWSSPQAHMQQCQKKDLEDDYIHAWANRRDVREALHIPEELDEIKWVSCNKSLFFTFGKKNDISYEHNIQTNVAYHKHLGDKKCRALVISGDHDLMIPYMGTLKWIKSLNFPIVNDWRPWFIDEQVAGYTMIYSTHEYNLTFATIKGGGHLAEEYTPKEAFNMVMRWLANDAL